MWNILPNIPEFDAYIVENEPGPYGSNNSFTGYDDPEDVHYVIPMIKMLEYFQLGDMQLIKLRSVMKLRGVKLTVNIIRSKFEIF